MPSTRPQLAVPSATTPGGRALGAPRRFLRMLIAPMMTSFVAAHDEQAGAIDLVRQSVDANIDLCREKFMELDARDREVADRLWDLGEAVNGLRSEVADLSRRVDVMADQAAMASALAWDQEAVVRRLAELEDRLAAHGSS